MTISLLAAAAVTACSSQSQQSAPAATAAAAHSAAAAPGQSCKQQYQAWKNGPALPVSKKLTTALNAAQSDDAIPNVPETLKDLQAAGSAAAELARYPIPKCADPGGYWAEILSHIKAAGDNAASASGLQGLLLAEEPAKDLNSLGAKLDAELKARGVG